MANDKDKEYSEIYSDAVGLSVKIQDVLKDDAELDQINLRLSAIVDYISKARMRKITGITGIKDIKE
jgi:hypothetical protein